MWGPVFGLIDLERATCATALFEQRLGHMPHPAFTVRIAKRTIESWLMADRAGFAAFMAVSLRDVPLDPEAELDPKRTVVNLARRSRRREVRETIAPTDDMRGAKVGREYLPKLREFVSRHWNITHAAANAPSLRRACAAIEGALTW